MAFSTELKKRIAEVSGNYPTPESAILPALHLIQRELKFISDESIAELARELKIPASYIYSTASFYTMFNLKPVGRYHLQVCRNLSCSLLGARTLVEYIREKLGISPGQTTSDGKFTLSLVECLGACQGAPVMMVNDKYYENLDEKKIDDILESIG